jgi:CheY-like chemotaxis protein
MEIMERDRTRREQADTPSGSARFDRPSAPSREWVLLVDDDPITRRSTSRFIKARTGALVHVACDWAEARELVERESSLPHALVLDCQLSGRVSGLGVLSGLRRLGCNAPCAFLTGAADKLRVALKRRPQERCPLIFSRADGVEGLLQWLEKGAIAA